MTYSDRDAAAVEPSESTLGKDEGEAHEALDSATSRDQERPIWPLWKRIAFRFGAAYFVFYTFPFPISELPLVGSMARTGVAYLWQFPATWLGNALFGIEGPIRSSYTGSGDTLYHYLVVFLAALLAALTTLIWSVLDRNRKSYTVLARWWLAGCAFYLGFALLTYGLMKVMLQQFSPPSPHRLVQTYGDSSPMGLAWTFFGFSPAYTFFMGLTETLAALPLFLRRTRLLGALAACAILANVVMVNLCFDVPVKLFSLHLLAFAILLVLAERRRLVSFFLTRKPLPAPPHRPLLQDPENRRVLVGAAAVWVGLAILVGLAAPLVQSALLEAQDNRPTFRGVHRVETFIADGQETPPLLTDDTRWYTVFVHQALPLNMTRGRTLSRITFQAPDGSQSARWVQVDSSEGTLAFYPPSYRPSFGKTPEEPTDTVLHYTEPEPGRLHLSGMFEGRRLDVSLREIDLEEMTLTSRGFHWISEAPYNR